MKNKNTHLLNTPGFLYLNESLLAKIKETLGDDGEGTVDDLGLSPLYDKISELIFPWCSTLTTRARYFFYSYAVLRAALEKIVPQNAINPNFEKEYVVDEARKKLGPFRNEIRKIEKYLALTLILKNNQDGAFGKIKVKSWIKGDIVPEKSRILSLDSRFPNSIYRASCRKLGLFAHGGQYTSLIESRLLGQDPFDKNWENAGRIALAEINKICLFWKKNERNNEIYLKGIKEQVKKNLKGFRGFNLTYAEAEFLLLRIKNVTPYWGGVSSPALVKLCNEEIDFTKLELFFKKRTVEKKYFRAAESVHII